MNHQAIEALYNERLRDIEKVIDIQSSDDPDLRQEGQWGAYLALQKVPTATNRYLLNKSQWEMVSSIRRGRSVDNGFYKRKNLKVIHYDHLPLADGVFAEAVSSNGKDPVDDQAIFRVSLERLFIGSLATRPFTSGTRQWTACRIARSGRGCGPHSRSSMR